MSALSTPMPNAFVATITGVSPPHEAILNLIAVFGLLSAVICERLHTAFPQIGRDGLGILVCCDVYNARLFRELHAPKQRVALLIIRPIGVHTQGDVWPFDA